MSVLLTPYNPNWKLYFDELKAQLSTILEAYSIEIVHVGSTAIPGLCAKPILDIDIVFYNVSEISGITLALEKHGYIAKGEQGIEGRFAFRQSADNVPFTQPKIRWQAHHLYACLHDSLALKNHLVFKKMLLNNSDLLNKYAVLKQQLSQTSGMTRELYAQQKTDYIVSVLSFGGLNSNEIEIIKNNNL